MTIAAGSDTEERERESNLNSFHCWNKITQTEREPFSTINGREWRDEWKAEAELYQTAVLQSRINYETVLFVPVMPISQGPANCSSQCPTSGPARHRMFGSTDILIYWPYRTVIFYGFEFVYPSVSSYTFDIIFSPPPQFTNQQIITIKISVTEWLHIILGHFSRVNK